MQRIPVNHEFATGGFVLLGPVHEEVKAGVVDVYPLSHGTDLPGPNFRFARQQLSEVGPPPTLR